MNDSSSRRRRRGLWWKIPLGLLLVLVVLLLAVWSQVSTIATRVANDKLPEVLGTEASVDRVELKLLSGVAALHGLRIAQPEGFGDGAVVELAHLRAEVDTGSFKSPDGILVRSIELKGLKANVMKDAAGVLNLLKLGPPPAAEAGTDPAAVPAGDAPAAGEGATAGGTATGEPAAEPFPGLRIGKVSVSDIALNYSDASTGDRPIEIALGNLELELRDGRVEIDELPRITLGEGHITLKDIEIAQPAGFGDEPLLVLPRLHLDIGEAPFVANVVTLQRLEIEGLRAVIARATNGVMNVQRLAGGPPPEPADADSEAVETAEANGTSDTAEDGDGAAAAADAAAMEETPAPPPVGFHLGELVLSDFAITYSDAALGTQEPIEIRIEDLALQAEHLMAFLSEPPFDAADVDLRLNLAQGDQPPARLALFARVGPVGAGVPDVNAQAKLTGFLIDTIGALVPPGVKAGVGAEGADLTLDLALNAQAVDLEGRVRTDAGHAYPVMVKGPLEKPKVDLGPIAMAVAGRLTGGVQNLATGAAGAAGDVAEGVGKGAGTLAKGAASTASGIAGGLFKSVSAAARLDVKGVGEGLRGTATGAVSSASATIGETSGTVMSGAQQGVANVTGAKGTAEWIEGIPSRHEEDVAAAREALSEMPWPPVVE